MGHNNNNNHNNNSNYTNDKEPELSLPDNSENNQILRKCLNITVSQNLRFKQYDAAEKKYIDVDPSNIANYLLIIVSLQKGSYTFTNMCKFHDSIVEKFGADYHAYSCSSRLSVLFNKKVINPINNFYIFSSMEPLTFVKVTQPDNTITTYLMQELSLPVMIMSPIKLDDVEEFSLKYKCDYILEDINYHDPNDEEPIYIMMVNIRENRTKMALHK